MCIYLMDSIKQYQILLVLGKISEHDILSQKLSHCLSNPDSHSMHLLSEPWQLT